MPSIIKLFKIDYNLEYNKEIYFFYFYQLHITQDEFKLSINER
jgi:hypothetical protein